jgi:hypothetical protein
MTTTSVLAVPGIHRVDQTFLRALAAMVDRHGWDIDGVAGVISHESGFNPAAHTPIPGQTATGLLQFIESTARSLGTTTDALRTMSALQQLPYVERFFQRTLRTVPTQAEDYILATFGRADLVGAPDDTVIDRANADDPREAERYRVNSALDATGKGYITVADLRASARVTLERAGGVRVQIISPGSGGGAGPGGMGLLAAFGGLFVVAGLMQRRRLSPRELDTGLRQIEHDGQRSQHVEDLAPLRTRHRVAANQLDRLQWIAGAPLECPPSKHVWRNELRTRAPFQEQVAFCIGVLRDQIRHARIHQQLSLADRAHDGRQGRSSNDRQDAAPTKDVYTSNARWRPAADDASGRARRAESARSRAQWRGTRVDPSNRRRGDAAQGA